MKVVGRHVLDNFAQNHTAVLSQIRCWVHEVENAKWQRPIDIKHRYPHASILSDNRVIFNLKGNAFRLETKINYSVGLVLIKRIGTHAEYAKWSF